MIYLDHQATTPLAPEALEAMLPWLSGPEAPDGFGGYANPHSAHKPGRAAAAAVAVARDQVSALLPPGGKVVFTSGATEAISLAILGSARGSARDGPSGGSGGGIAHSAIEHAAVIETALASGAPVQILPVGPAGLVDPEVPFAPGTRLVAVMQVNNEIGTIQPVDQLAARACAAGALFLCDAVQGAGKLAAPENADLIAVSAHKLYGPKGIGALWVRDGVELAPLIHGGGQEGGLRAGTLSPALCAGFGAAAALTRSRMEADFAHLSGLSALARSILARWTLNGSVTARWPGNLNLRLDGLDVPRLMGECRELAFSAGSACGSGSGKPSHVLAALGLDARAARGSIRLGFGRYSTRVNVEEACRTIENAAASQGVLVLVKVSFVTVDGVRVATGGVQGQSLLAVAQAAGMPLEGTCEGQMACSTCHVVVAPEWFDKLPQASPEEEDMLDLAAGVARTSRLSCQILLAAELDGIEVRIPGESHDMQRR